MCTQMGTRPSRGIGRDDLHRLVDELPENELNAARRYLEFIRETGRDPVRWALENAPLDDEPETDEEKQAVEEGKADIRAGRTMTSDELRRELGI